MINNLYKLMILNKYYIVNIDMKNTCLEITQKDRLTDLNGKTVIEYFENLPLKVLESKNSITNFIKAKFNLEDYFEFVFKNKYYKITFKEIEKFDILGLGKNVFMKIWVKNKPHYIECSYNELYNLRNNKVKEI